MKEDAKLKVNQGFTPASVGSLWAVLGDHVVDPDSVILPSLIALAGLYALYKLDTVTVASDAMFTGEGSESPSPSAYAKNVKSGTSKHTHRISERIF